MPTNVNQELKAKLQKPKVSKAVLRLFKGQAKRAYGHTGVSKVRSAG